MSQSTRETALRSRFAQAEWLAVELAHVRDEWRWTGIRSCDDGSPAS